MMFNRLLKIKSKTRDEMGMTLIDVIVMMVILAIAVVPLSRLAVINLKSSANSAMLTRAMFYAQEVMEQIVADYEADDANPPRGYDWVRYNWYGSAPNPPAGLSGYVSISSPATRNGVEYVVVQVTVSGTEIPNVNLSTWLVNDN